MSVALNAAVLVSGTSDDRAVQRNAAKFPSLFGFILLAIPFIFFIVLVRSERFSVRGSVSSSHELSALLSPPLSFGSFRMCER